MKKQQRETRPRAKSAGPVKQVRGTQSPQPAAGALDRNVPVSQEVVRGRDSASVEVHAAALDRSPSKSYSHRFLAQLSRRYGNRYVQRVLAMHRSGAQANGADLAFTRDIEEEETTGGMRDTALGAVQKIGGPQLTVSSPGDIYEQEAEAVAKEVASNQAGPDSLSESLMEGLGLRQIMMHRNQEDEGSRWVNLLGMQPGRTPEVSASKNALRVYPDGRRSRRDENAVSGPIASQIQSSKGKGTPLPDSVRHNMESHMGHDFGSVRVKSDPNSAYLCRALGARAFTNGRDIWLGQGESVHNVRLMAHELTHVMQQGAAPQASIQGISGRAVSNSRVLDHLHDLVTGRTSEASRYQGEVQRFKRQYTPHNLAAMKDRILGRQSSQVTPALGKARTVQLAMCGGGGGSTPTQFPTIGTITADATVEAARAADWTAGQADNNERSGWMMWDSSTDTFTVPAAHQRTGSWDRVAVAPTPADSGTVYSVAWYHQHPPLPPAQQPNTHSFPVGPSAADRQISTDRQRPGVVRDFTNTNRTTVRDYTYGPRRRPGSP